ncbi:hypothetical protein Tco_0736805 [Tanacetum coccineum]
MVGLSQVYDAKDTRPTFLDFDDIVKVGKRTLIHGEVSLLKEIEDRVIPHSDKVVTVVEHTIMDELRDTDVDKRGGIKRVVFDGAEPPIKKSRTGDENRLEQESLDRVENVDFDLVKCYLCTSLIEGHTLEGIRLRVVESDIGNHHEDDFTPLETIRRFLGVDPKV